MEKAKFIREIIKNRDDKIRLFKNVEICLETQVSELRQREIDPNLIICSRTKVLHDRDFRSSKKFNRAPLIGFTNNPNNMDFYDRIPIYYIEDRDMPYIIVSKFEQSFLMKIRKLEESIESIFNIEVYEFTRQEAEELIEQNNSTWTKDDEGNQLTREKSLEKILSSVKIEVFTELEFIINDRKMYQIGRIMEA